MVKQVDQVKSVPWDLRKYIIEVRIKCHTIQATKTRKLE